MNKQIENIRVRLHVRGKDNFTEFPDTVESALKIIGKNLCDLKKIIKLHRLDIYTFKDTKDYFEVRYKKS